MARPTMRRPSLALLGLLGLLALPVPGASAQEPLPSIRLTLLSQTPWNSAFDPVNQREVLLRFRAENLGVVPVGDLSIGVTLYGRVISRTAYEDALVADPAFVLDAETLARDGTLDPGQPRDFEVAFPLDSPGIDPDDSGVYPLKIDLRSGFSSLAELRTSAVFLVREPELPLAVSWTFVLHHRIEFGPDDVFLGPDLELSLSPGGRLSGQIQALLDLANDPAEPAVDVAISPTLLTQLGRMRRGYEVATEDGTRVVPPDEGGARLAEVALEDLGTIAEAPNVRISALPFSSPELPSLLAGGLGRDLPEQLERGRRVVEEFLSVPPVSGVLRPPGAALDEETLEGLAASGVLTIVGGPSTVEPLPQPLGFAGPPTAAIGDGELLAIVPDPAVAALTQSSLPALDPVGAAHAVLGELAAIWQEQPGLERGIALIASEDLLAPSSFYLTLARGIAGAPWLAPMHAAEFVAAFPPAEPSELASPTARRFSSAYVEELRQARRRVDTFRSMLAQPSEEPDRFDTLLLLAESRQFLSDPEAGLVFIDAVRDSVGAIFAGIAVQAPPEITLTSRSGSGIPVTVSSDASESLRVSVVLESPHLRGVPRIDLVLAPRDSQTVTFPVELQSTGRFEVTIRVIAPGGRPLEETEMVVRSTVYNRIALAITLAAALTLFALWARRFLPRRTS